MRGSDGSRDPHPRCYPGCGFDLVLQQVDFLPGFFSGFRLDRNGGGQPHAAMVVPCQSHQFVQLGGGMAPCRSSWIYGCGVDGKSCRM